MSNITGEEELESVLNENKNLRRYYYSKLLSNKERRAARKVLPALIERSGGTCDLCPFRVVPLLVPHHIRFLEHGGQSQSTNLVAVCPNCHALIHYIHRQLISLKKKYDLLMGCGVRSGKAKRLLAIATEAVAINETGEVVDRRVFHPLERSAHAITLLKLGVSLVQNHNGEQNK